MARILIALVLITTLSGCSLFKKKECSDVKEIETQVVKIPVFQCPDEAHAITRPDRPLLTKDLLTQDDVKQDPGAVGKAYVIDSKSVQSYAIELEQKFDALKGICAKPVENQ